MTWRGERLLHVIRGRSRPLARGMSAGMRRVAERWSRRAAQHPAGAAALAGFLAATAALYGTAASRRGRCDPRAGGGLRLPTAPVRHADRMSTHATGRVESVNVGDPRAVEVNGHTVWTAIWKRRADGRVALRGVNLHGDDQADRTVHGGPDKAVYAYALEDTRWWEALLGAVLGEAPFGENLTVTGVPVSEAVIGERWAVGTTLLEVAQPRLPCFKLGLRMGDPRFLRQFAEANRPGAYLRVVREGDIGAGDAIEVISRPAHGVTSALVSRALLSDPQLLDDALQAPELPTELRDWMRARSRSAAERG